jgi:hypothetical protein
MNDTAIFVIGLIVSGLVAAFVVMAWAAMRADSRED